MSVMQLLRLILLAAEIWIAIPILYLCILTFTAILVTKKRHIERSIPSSRLDNLRLKFAILIPAHNEEIMLPTLLESLSALAYPKDQYDIYVVADNCNDLTSEVARSTGWVHVYERFEEAKRGKGYALEWLLQKLEENQLIYDAYVILDADSVVEPNFLQAMARELNRNEHALQADSTVSNAFESPSTVLRLIALTLFYHIRALGRNALGASSTLNGDGMCFSRTLLERFPWHSHSLSEDYQYYLTLIQHGERVRYVPDAIVRSHMPASFVQMRTQDIRWESMGEGPTTWQLARGLLKTGLRLRKFVCFEAVIELLTPPLSFLVGWCLLSLLLSLFTWSLLPLILSLVLIAGLTFYVGTALYFLKLPKKVYKALLYVPGFVLWKLWVIFVLRRSKKHTSEWIRTSRPISTK